MFNKSIFLTSSGCSHRLFSYHISEVYAFYPINEREKQGRWGGGSCKKGELHMEEKRPKARREYKDTVFRMLFSDEKNLLSQISELRKAVIGACIVKLPVYIVADHKDIPPLYGIMDSL